jgi:pimeloyl-ACP methyl ester carboxylesterase
MQPLVSSVLPEGVRARILPGINGLDIHVLEAGFESQGRPAVLLLHGFPELAYSWRKVMPALAAAGYHAIAPDQRGYGRTTGWDADYDGDLSAFRFMNLVRDAIGVLFALGHRTAEAVVGHDFGASVAAYAALIRPDIFKRMVLMSAPFGGPPAIPFDTAGKPAAAKGHDIHAAMAALPRPRKHYQWYYSTRPANENMWKAKQGVHAFLRAYYHHKSADWKANKPFELAGWTAEEMAKMPTYYIMDLADGMAETVAKEMPSPAEIASNTWLTEPELGVYSAQYERKEIGRATVKERVP